MYESLLSKSNVIKQEQSSWIVADTAQSKQHSRARNDFSELINKTIFINLTHMTVNDRILS
jgi:hypothetical protein